MDIEGSNRFGKATDGDLGEFEAAIGFALPEDYRRFLREHNGGRPEPSTFLISEEEGESGVHNLYGLHDGPSWASLRHALLVYRDRIPAGTIPIGSDPLGNAILLVVAGSRRGSVCFWDHEREGEEAAWDNVTVMTTSFAAFLDGLHEFQEPEELQDDEVTRRIAANDLAWLTRLLDSGVSPNAKNKFGHPLAAVAAIEDRPDVLRLLAARGAELRGTLGFAAQNGHTRSVEAILDLEADVNERSSEGGTALMAAAAFGHEETVRLLLARKADVDAVDGRGRSALRLARWGENREIVRILTELGARDAGP